MNVTLIHPHVPLEVSYGSKFKTLGAVLPPLGLLYIGAYLEKQGHSVKLLDLNRHPELAAQLPKTIRDAPDIVGFSATTVAFEEANRLAGIVKQAFPDALTAIGGCHAQGLPEDAVRGRNFDVVITGEGEESMRLLCEAISSKASLAGVPGIGFMENGKYINTGKGLVVEKLDNLPHPARHLLPDLTHYRQKAFGYTRLPMSTIYTSRGCPFNCIFCSSPMQRKEIFGNRLRYHSLAYVKEELDILSHHYGMREIYVVDDTFNTNRQRVTDFCAMMLEHFPGIAWSCNFEVNIASPEMLKMMKKAGCWLIQIGVETGDAEIMQLIKKGITLEQVETVTAWAREAGLVTKASFILGHPGETEESIERTIQFACKLSVDVATFGLMVPLPGTELWNIADQYGEVLKDDYSRFTMVAGALKPKGLSMKYLRKKQGEAFRRVYLRPSMILRHIGNLRSAADIKRYWRAAKAVIRL